MAGVGTANNSHQFNFVVIQNSDAELLNFKFLKYIQKNSDVSELKDKKTLKDTCLEVILYLFYCGSKNSTMLYISFLSVYTTSRITFFLQRYIGMKSFPTRIKH